MRRLFLIIPLLLLFTNIAYAGWVNGYYRKDGTYVSGHYRSNPNSTKSDNYGPSKSKEDYYNPYGRDNDNDGIPNIYDYDDDNDGVWDDYDSDQY